MLLWLVDHPEDFDKLPKRRLSVPVEHIVVPYEEVKKFGNFYIIPKKIRYRKIEEESFFQKIKQKPTILK